MSSNRLNGHTTNGRTRRVPVSNRSNREAAGPATPQRDARGHFLKGCAPGPGNPNARRMAALRAQLLEAVGEDGVKRVALALVKHVERGDLEAAKLLLRYCVGGVLPTVDPDMLDADELGKLQGGARVADVLRLDAVSPAVATILVRLMQRLSLQMAQAGPAGQLVGLGGWDKVFEELGDPELSEWWQELTELQREAQQAQAKGAAAAARQAGRADGGGGSDK
jgi:hypothetical protein